jgi:diketogulonate reductase-like aldo/keto reductase
VAVTAGPGITVTPPSPQRQKVAQVILRWLTQREKVIQNRSERIVENFELPEDMNAT